MQLMSVYWFVLVDASDTSTVGACLEVEVIISDCLYTVRGALDNIVLLSLPCWIYYNNLYLSAVLLNFVLSDKKEGCIPF